MPADQAVRSAERGGVVLIRGLFQICFLVVLRVFCGFSWFLDILEFVVFKRGFSNLHLMGLVVSVVPVVSSVLKTKQPPSEKKNPSSTRSCWQTFRV